MPGTVIETPFAVPTSGRPELLRARLLARVQQRWKVPVVVVIAGAGFGKTTLLAQARSENLLDPRGLDCWLSCGPDDTGASVLTGHLAGALGQAYAPTQDLSAADLANLITSAAPTHVSVFVDDAHLISKGGGGARVLEDLIRVLPSNGHLVLASRPPLPIPIARLQAQGRLLAIDESEMAFDMTETSAFAAMRLTDPGLITKAGGWPALAELHASADRDSAMNFLWDELLSSLPTSRQRHLAILSAIGRADDRLLSAAADEPLSVREVVRNVPLTSFTPDGSAALHDLWRPAVEHVLNPIERDAALGRAADVARSSERLADAFRLFADSSRWDDARAVIRQACANSHPLVPEETLRTWHTRITSTHIASPETTLLQGVIVKQTAPDEAVICMHRAAESYRIAGARDEEASCLFHLGHMFWWGDRNDELMALVERVAELAAEGSWLATSMMELGAVLLGAAAGDPALDPLDAKVQVVGQNQPMPLHPEIVPLRCWLLARNYLFSGEFREAQVAAEASAATATPTMRAVSEFLTLQCLWISGLADSRNRVLDNLDHTLDAVRREGWRHFTVANLAQAGMWTALCGDHQRARTYLSAAKAIPQLASVWSDAVVGIAGAVLAAADGDDDLAGRLLHDEILARPLEDPSADLAHRPWLCLSYVLTPGSRLHWDTAISDASGHALARQCARALVAVRARDWAAALRELPKPEMLLLERVRNALPAPWLAELAVLLEADGRGREAAALLGEAPVDARHSLRALTGAKSKAVAAGAVTLLKTVARAPAEAIEIDVFGSLRLRFGGEERWPAELNRRVVRSVLLLLVEHERLAREKIVAIEWPDADERAGKASLRSALSFLNKALEPARAEHELPYFIAEKGEMIGLTRGPHFVVDSDRFEASLRAGARAESQGALSVALEYLLDAIALYRGEYAADAGSAEWVLTARERFRVQFVSASVRAGALLSARGQADRAIELATRAISVEPWSEAARTLLGEAYLQLGDKTAARRAVEQCDAMLADLGVLGTRTLAMLRRRLTD